MGVCAGRCRALNGGRKGADHGIDGNIFFAGGKTIEPRHRLGQGRRQRRQEDPRPTRGVIEREKAAIGIFLTS